MGVAFALSAARARMLPSLPAFTTLSIAAALCGLGNGVSAGLVNTLGSDMAPKGAARGALRRLWPSVALLPLPSLQHHYHSITTITTQKDKL